MVIISALHSQGTGFDAQGNHIVNGASVVFLIDTGSSRFLHYLNIIRLVTFEKMSVLQFITCLLLSFLDMDQNFQD